MKFLLPLILLLIDSSFASEKLAQIAFLKGNVQVNNQKASEGQWISQGMVIQTAASSIARVVFKDKTQITVAPQSKLEITTLKSDAPPMLSLLDGIIRSKVQKQLTGEGAGKDKLLITTRTAAMGVRGTEINVSFNSKNKLTNVITYNGELKMAQKDASSEVDHSNIHDLIDSEDSVTIPEGRFSSANPALGNKTTIPVKLSPPQFFGMKNNKDFNTSGGLARKGQSFRSIVLPGVRPSTIFINQSGLKKTLTVHVDEPNSDSVSLVQSSTDFANDPPPEGFRDPDTGQLAPPAGGLIDQNTGIYLAPPPGSLYDENTGVYTLPADYGTLDPRTGEYHPPEGYQLHDNGEFLASGDSNRKSKQVPPSLASSESWGSAAYADGTAGNIMSANGVENSNPLLNNDDVMALSDDVLRDFNNQFYGDSIERRTLVNMGFAF
ncbi:MAG: hypothetical protein A2X86_11445 [Bdellovibrionales bacterium GWA2_49_15]|nr:MAG: hypothetical protein A2X86_11445 [Bdellovibrionales bacterium GWA2_49_15]HAZ12635.1 hypothetical protein [Bdellovibrionales bacterium]